MTPSLFEDGGKRGLRDFRLNKLGGHVREVAYYKVTWQWTKKLRQ